MRGVQVDVTRFRQLRRARGLTQPELGRLAGVSERTVRNAELGHRIRLDFLRFLAVALGIEVVDVVHDNDELRTALLEQRRVDHILAANEALVHDGDLAEFSALAAENVLVNIPGPSEVLFCGQYRGVDGMQRLEEIDRASVVYERAPEFADFRSSGNLVVISGTDWCRVIPTGKAYSSWWQQIYEFDKGRIVRVDIWGDTAAIAAAFRPGE